MIQNPDRFDVSFTEESIHLHVDLFSAFRISFLRFINILSKLFRVFSFPWEEDIYANISMGARLYQRHFSAAAKFHSMQEIMLFWTIFHLLHTL